MLSDFLGSPRGSLPNHEFAAGLNNFVQFGFGLVVIRYDLPGVTTRRV